MNYVKLVGPVTCTVQNILDQDPKNMPVRRINFICDTLAGAVTINLPQIALLGGTDVEWTVTVTNDPTGPNPVTINAFSGDKINNSTSLSVITDEEKLWGLISSKTNWAVIRTGCCDGIEVTEYFDNPETPTLTLAHTPMTGKNMIVWRRSNGFNRLTTATGTREYSISGPVITFVSPADPADFFMVQYTYLP